MKQRYRTSNTSSYIWFVGYFFTIGLLWNIIECSVLDYLMLLVWWPLVLGYVGISISKKG